MRLMAWIGSEFVQSDADSWTPSVDPSRPDDIVAEVPVGCSLDVDRAVEAAATAFPTWRTTGGPARAEALGAWADRVMARHEELAQAVSREVGKPIGESRGEVSRCVAILRYYAGEAVRTMGEVVPAQTYGPLQYSLRVPLGVVGLITPWNFPLAIPLWKAAPALAMGNSVVLKPSEMSGYCGQLLAETSMGLPRGVLNVVQGTGDGAGRALVAHPEVAAVSFTGSVKVGTAVQTACASRNARCQTEMGGKNAAVVLSDANLDRAASLVAAGAMRFAGQKCTATSRVIVERPVYHAFLERLIAQTEALAVGPVTDPGTALGPVASASSRDRLGALLSDPGAEVAYRSSKSADGFYVPPTILGPVESESPLAQEELFGPILTVLEADDAEHAVQIANATRFGLSTSVYTENVTRALTYIDQVTAGLVRVNGDTTGVDPHVPFGGTKASSSGSREQGSVAKDFYTEWKTVQINP